ncbi:hypothetical protein J2Z31_002813 [Sinorhizobium kostiense]|uniref:Uncharacterized protein n=1 Tax=Sinorhizobium kostiense TaxID=76747 RepID=A0ABS4R0T2_9HYPH|nr:hypothetical protein [Sinorhizobium kostiense]
MTDELCVTLDALCDFQVPIRFKSENRTGEDGLRPLTVEIDPNIKRSDRHRCRVKFVLLL